VVVTDSWGDVLGRLNSALKFPMDSSQVMLDGVVHVVSDNYIVIIKRNEKRFWTRSLGREDADITLVKRISDSNDADGGMR